MMNYYVEVTDTFGDELNYCWVRRYVVQANDIKKALRKVLNYSGFDRYTWNGDSDHMDYRVRGACIGGTVEFVDECDKERLFKNYSSIIEL